MRDRAGLQAGFAKLDITPDYPTGLGGYANSESRRHERVEDNIYATCIAVTEGNDTVLMFTIDNCDCRQEVAVQIRDVVSSATGIARDNIFCAATHCHSAPSVVGHPEAKMYVNKLLTTCARCAQLALEDRAPAKLKAAKKEIPGMNSVRHVQLENGMVASYNWRNYNSPIKDFFGPADRQLVLVKFAREEKRDILLINWQGHPDRAREIGFELLCPSFPGPLRDTVEAGSGMHVAYFTGADANMIIDCNAFFPERGHNMNWRRYGVKMGILVLEALDELAEVDGSGIATKHTTVEVDVDHSWDHMLPQANEVFDLWKSTDMETGNVLAKKYGFSSVYQARAIRTRAGMGKTLAFELGAFRIGGIGFTSGTYEMFAESGMQVKEGSPYEYTFLLTGNFSYLPCERNFEQRSYEVDTTLYARGAAEKLVNHYIEMLKEIEG